MKNLYIFFFALLIINHSVAQSCLPNGITFSAQSQVDSFPINYPNCTQIEGGMTIGGNPQVQCNISNLNGLTGLKSIGGDLVISFTGYLDSLTGLDSLISIGGHVSIVYNYALHNMVGLGSLTTLGSGLAIALNQHLTSLAGFNSLTSINGRFEIYYNENLASISGLSQLVSLGGYNLEIEGNEPLSSLSGLDNLDAGSIWDLIICGNTNLSICEVKSICEYLEIHDTAGICSNATGCNSILEIETACRVPMENLIPKSAFSVFPNPADTRITIETNNKGSLSILNLNGHEILQQEITEPFTQIDISILSSGVYLVKVMSEKCVQIGKIIKI